MSSRLAAFKKKVSSPVVRSTRWLGPSSAPDARGGTGWRWDISVRCSFRRPPVSLLLLIERKLSAYCFFAKISPGVEETVSDGSVYLFNEMVWYAYQSVFSRVHFRFPISIYKISGLVDRWLKWSASPSFQLGNWYRKFFIYDKNLYVICGIYILPFLGRSLFFTCCFLPVYLFLMFQYPEFQYLHF